jgi:methionyl-tRNA synthetase
VLDVVKVPKSSRLYKLHVDLGFEKRIIVSGIREHYEEADLIGKKVIVVANLKPARIMGVESQGMILAASFDNALEVPELHDLPPGSAVT